MKIKNGQLNYRLIMQFFQISNNTKKINFYSFRNNNTNVLGRVQKSKFGGIDLCVHNIDESART